MAPHNTASPKNLPQAEPAIRDELVATVYDQLRSLAEKYLRKERNDHTLQPTALVHEAYIRLTEQKGFEWQNESHFIGVAALMMRRVLTNYALSHKRKKRGGGLYKIDISTADLSDDENEVDILSLDAALERLAVQYPQESRIVELRFFGGLSIAETASVLEISESTVKRDFKFARLWLLRELSHAPTAEDGR